jgi:hypothetical protein
LRKNISKQKYSKYISKRQKCDTAHVLQFRDGQKESPWTGKEKGITKHNTKCQGVVTV